MYGDIVSVYTVDGIPFGSITVRSALVQIPLQLIRDPKSGDRVLIVDGMAIEKVTPESERKI